MGQGDKLTRWAIISLWMRTIQFSYCTVLIKSTQLPELRKEDYKEKFSKGDDKLINCMQDGLPTSIWSFLPVKMWRLSSVIPTNQNHNDNERFNFSDSEIGRSNAARCTIFLFCVSIHMCLLNVWNEDSENIYKMGDRRESGSAIASLSAHYQRCVPLPWGREKHNSS